MYDVILCGDAEPRLKCSRRHVAVSYTAGKILRYKIVWYVLGNDFWLVDFVAHVSRSNSECYLHLIGLLPDRFASRFSG